MKTLPYFLAAIKKSAILWTIITTGSFASINYNSLNHKSLGSNYLLLKSFPLSAKDTFDYVTVRKSEDGVILSFFTKKYIYTKNPMYYFGRDELNDTTESYRINGKKAHDISKNLGNFDVGIGVPVQIEIVESADFSNKITLYVFNKHFWEMAKKARDSLKQMKNN